MGKLWCQEVLEKDFPREQQVDRGEKALKSDTELTVVPEWLRPLLWETWLLQDKLEVVTKAFSKEKISGLTLPEFLAKQEVAERDSILRIMVLRHTLWFELKQLPELQTETRLTIRKEYKVVRPAPKEPKEGGEEERKPSFLIGLLRKLG